MYSVPKFTVYEDKETPEGVFEWGSSRDELFETYYEAADLFFLGDLKEAKKMLDNILKKDAHFLNAYNLLGDIESSWGNWNKARKHHLKALEMGNRIIPDGFEGHIRWGFTENRPFLSSLHAAGLYHMDEGEYDEAARLLEQLLTYNPDDNQGIRYIMGDLYFLQNNYKKAETYYRQNLDFPPCLYSYGLLHFCLGNNVKAITLFRKAILENIYISDLLRTKIPLIPYEIWHSSNFEMPETAYSYAETMMLKWIEFPGALDLLQYLHIAYPSSAEISETYMLKNELYFLNSGFDDEEELKIREEVLEEIEKIKADISDQTSKQIYKAWKEDPFSSNYTGDFN